jgi:3',5'-cyclic AMP phosphodiesterase CpdA
MYSEITQGLNMPVHQTIGNHDIFGIDPAAGVSENHPEHGKKMFASRVGNGSTYRSFDFQDWHFVLLDSVSVTSELGYEGRIDQQQFNWLQKDLKSVGTQRPVVLVSHIPFFSILPMMLEFTRSLLNKNSRRLAPAVKRYLGNDLNHSHLIIPHLARKSSLEPLKNQAGVLTTEAEAVL